MTENSYRMAPPGFTAEQWEEFMEKGMLVFENALTPDEVELSQTLPSSSAPRFLPRSSCPPARKRPGMCGLPSMA